MSSFILLNSYFTTNFDDLVETAYRNSPDRKQRCEQVFSDDFSRRQSDYIEALRLFKLMGCINGRNSDSQMALSRSDYNRKLRRRGGLFKLLYDFAKDGTIVYIGYSFQDLIARDILDEVADEVGLNRLPWAWALLPEWDSATEQMLKQRKVLPLSMTFEEFIDRVAHTSEVPLESPQIGGATVSISGGVVVDIPPDDLKMYSRYFQILHDGIGQSEKEDNIESRREYLEGKSNPWGGIVRNWALRRPVYSKIHSEVLKYMSGPHEKTVPVILLDGPAGVGKSTLGRILCYDIYQNEGFPSIFLHPENDQVDFVVIDSFYRQLEASLIPVDGRKVKLPMLIVVDEAAAHIQDIRRLPQYLASRGIHSVILAISRENEWRLAQGDYPLQPTSASRIADALDTENDEALAIVRHFRQLDVLVSAQDNRYWSNRILKVYENSFSTTLYYLVEPTRPPLSEAIKSEYESLTELAKQAYRNVCLFYQFSVPLDLELLARSLGCSYELFETSVYSNSSAGVIVEDVTITGEVRFRARSRLVAERVVEYAFKNKTEWLQEVCMVVSNCLPHNSSEVQTIRNMLIHRLGPRGAEPQNLDLVKSIFEAALNAGIQDSATLHHFALLLLDQEAFEDAESYACQALSVLNNDHARMHFKTESRQNLHNTLGMICSRHGLYREARNKKGALDLFDKAVNYFRSARSGGFAGSYPYYSESWMLYQRARSTSSPDSLRHVAAAFQVLDESEGNVGDDDMATIKEMEAKLIQFISTVPNFQDALASLIAEGDPVAEYLTARYTASEKGCSYDPDHAYKVVMDALDANPTHIACLRLASRLHHQLYPCDFEGWKGLLDRRFSLEDKRSQCGLLFDLGYASSQLSKYSEASKYFIELEAESIGHPKRSGIIKIIRDRDESRKFTGLVTTQRSRVEGWLTSEVIGDEIKFIPVAQKFTVLKGQTVTFNLALNYRGFFAVELRIS